MSFEWENGRILKKINTSDKSVQMSYDSNGMRTQKTVDGVKTNYYYDSSNNLFALTQGNDTLFFYYDNSGEVMSVSCNGTMYYYIKDLQGDITEIVDKDGKAVAEYAYDAWGNMLTEDNGTLTVGKLNPFRYRSYVYDEETGLYYLQSRYYDPLTGRFLNADVYCDTESGTPLSTNMFAYCENNILIYIDKSGSKSKTSRVVYNRINALSYAQHNYLNERDKNGFRYYKGRDCANFVSQCLFSGGIKMNNNWYFQKNNLGRDWYSTTWTFAPHQYKYFKKWGFTKYVININLYSYRYKLKSLIQKYNIRGGDLLYMDFNGNGHIDHATMITGRLKFKELLYTAHTSAAYGRKVSSVFYNHPKCIMKIIVLI